MPKNLFYGPNTGTLRIIMKSGAARTVIFYDDFRDFTKEQLAELEQLKLDYQQWEKFSVAQHNKL